MTDMDLRLERKKAKKNQKLNEQKKNQNMMNKKKNQNMKWKNFCVAYSTIDVIVIVLKA